MICITWDSIHCHPKTVAHEILTLCYYGLRDPVASIELRGRGAVLDTRVTGLRKFAPRC